MSFANSFDGAKLWFDVLGQDGDPILLIAGNGCDHHTWDGVREELAKTHRVISYDHRGTGQSDANFPQQWSTRDFARDALSVLQAASCERAHVYGHSMGGRVAQWLAIDAPESVGALILGATSPGGENAVPRSAAATAAMASNDPATLQRMCYTDAWIEVHGGATNASAPNPRSREAFIAHLMASTDHNAWDHLPGIKVPTLVIHGDEDQITSVENAKVLAARIPAARLMIVQSARHVYWAGFAEVNETVLAFCQEHRIV